MDERELVAGLAARNPEAISALVQRYAPLMLAHARTRVDSPEDAEDAVYGLIARWCERPPSIARPLIPFLLRSVTNAVIDGERKRKRQTGMHPRTPSGLVEPDRRKKGPLEARRTDETPEEFHMICSEALAALSDGDRQVLEFAYLRTMAPKEKAGEMNKTIGAYEKRLHDARGRFKRTIAAVRARRAKAPAQAGG
jgi:RNA polymerase sigma factor (sigma-70 family)